MAPWPVENLDGAEVTVENQPEMSEPGGLIQRGTLGSREPKGAVGDWTEE
jgi:hypothetical protein